MMNEKTLEIEEKLKAEAFFKEIEEVFKKHGMSIGHEDGHGAFIIYEYDDAYMQWLRDAQLFF